MFRYSFTIIFAEIVGLISLWIFVNQHGVHQHLAGGIAIHATPYPGSFGLVEGLDSRAHGLDIKAFELATDLDLLDNCIPFVIGFPAIAVFALRTYELRRQRKAGT